MHFNRGLLKRTGFKTQMIYAILVEFQAMVLIMGRGVGSPL